MWPYFCFLALAGTLAAACDPCRSLAADDGMLAEAPPLGVASVARVAANPSTGYHTGYLEVGIHGDPETSPASPLV